MKAKDIKAIFFDIDGTLVSFKTHRIPQSTLKAVHNVRKKGIKIFIATGRPLPFVNNLGELEYDGIMSVNGARCQTKDGKVIRNCPIDKADIQNLVNYCKEKPLSMAFTSAGEAYQNFASQDFHDIFTLLDINEPAQMPIEHCLEMEIMQLVIFIKQEEEKEIMKQVLPHCSTQRWHPAFADVISKGNSKQQGVDAICKYYDIPLSQTMAFGDGGNDISMLNHVKYGYAMGNAKQEVLDAVTLHTSSVDDDGVAQILNQLL